MEEKNDIFLSMMQGSLDPNLDNTLANGFDNILLSKEDYLANDKIKERFTDKEGNFDESLFDNTYEASRNYYKDLSTHDYDVSNITGMMHDSFYTRYIGAKTVKNPITVKKAINPGNIVIGGEGINKISKETISAREQASMQNRVWDTDNKTWVYTSKDKDDQIDLYEFITQPTMVLAQWEEDGKHYDEFLQKEVYHKKGQNKTDEYGKTYNEYLGTRDPTGRQIVTLGNSLTEEGSFLNKYDFFDSDDVEKSFTGYLAKNAFSIGIMFVPYVGTAYAYANLGKGLLDSGIEAYKAVDGIINGTDKDEYKTGNKIQGILESYFGGSASDVGMQNPFGAENLFNMVGSFATDLASQRAAGTIIKRAAFLTKGSTYKNMIKTGSKLKKFQEAVKLSRDAQKVREGLGNLNTVTDVLSRGTSYIYNIGVASKEIGDASEKLGLSSEDKGMLTMATYLTMGALFKFAPFERMATAGLGLDDTAMLTRNAIRATADSPAFAKMVKELPSKIGNAKYPAMVETMLNGFKKAATNSKFGKGLSREGLLGSSLSEAAEESSEVLLQEALKEGYNFAQEKGYTKTKDKQFKFDLKKLGAELALSAIGGAAGGAFYRLAYPSSLTTDPTVANLVQNGHSKLLYSKLEKDRKKGKLASTLFTTESDGKGGWKTKDEAPDAMTQNDFVANTIKRNIEITETLLQKNGVDKDSVDKLADSLNDSFNTVFSESMDKKNIITSESLKAMMFNSFSDAKNNTSLLNDVKVYSNKLLDIEAELVELKKEPGNEEKVKELEAKKTVLQNEFQSIKNIINKEPSEKVDYYYQQSLFSMFPNFQKTFGVKSLNDFIEREPLAKQNNISSQEQLYKSELSETDIENIEDNAKKNYEEYVKGESENGFVINSKSEDMIKAFEAFQKYKQNSEFGKTIERLKKDDFVEFQKMQDLSSFIQTYRFSNYNFENLKRNIESGNIPENITELFNEIVDEETNEDNFVTKIINYLENNNYKSSKKIVELLTPKETKKLRQEIANIQDIFEDNQYDFFNNVSTVFDNGDDTPYIFDISFDNLNTISSKIIENLKSYKDLKKEPDLINNILKLFGVKSEKNFETIDKLEIEDLLSDSFLLKKISSLKSEIKKIEKSNVFSIKKSLKNIEESTIEESFGIFDQYGFDDLLERLNEKSKEGSEFIDGDYSFRNEIKEKREELEKQISYLVNAIHLNPNINLFRKYNKYIPNNIKEKEEIELGKNIAESNTLAQPLFNKIKSYLYDLSLYEQQIEFNERVQYTNLVKESYFHLVNQMLSINNASGNKYEEELKPFVELSKEIANTFDIDVLKENTKMINEKLIEITETFINDYNTDNSFKESVNTFVSTSELEEVNLTTSYSPKVQASFVNSLIKLKKGDFKQFKKLYKDLLSKEDQQYALLENQEMILFSTFAHIKSDGFDLLYETTKENALEKNKSGKEAMPFLLNNFLFINGIPGGGKTFMSEFIIEINNMLTGKETMFTAPNQRQVENLNKKLGKIATKKSNVKELISELSGKEIIPYNESEIESHLLKTNKQDFNAISERFNELDEETFIKFSGYNLIVIDEITHIDLSNASLLNHIIEKHNEYRTLNNIPLLKLVTLGDTEQRMKLVDTTIINGEETSSFKADYGVHLQTETKPLKVILPATPKLNKAIRNEDVYVPEFLETVRKAYKLNNRNESFSITPTYWENEDNISGVLTAKSKEENEENLSKLINALEKNKNTDLIIITNQPKKLEEYGIKLEDASRVRTLNVEEAIVMTHDEVQGSEGSYIYIENLEDMAPKKELGQVKDDLKSFYTMASRSKKAVAFNLNDVNQLLGDLFTIKESERDLVTQPRSNITISTTEEENNTAEKIKQFKIDTIPDISLEKEVKKEKNKENKPEEEKSKNNNNVVSNTETRGYLNGFIDSEFNREIFEERSQFLKKLLNEKDTSSTIILQKGKDYKGEETIQLIIDGDVYLNMSKADRVIDLNKFVKNKLDSPIELTLEQLKQIVSIMYPNLKQLNKEEKDVNFYDILKPESESNYFVSKPFIYFNEKGGSYSYVAISTLPLPDDLPTLYKMYKEDKEREANGESIKHGISLLILNSPHQSFDVTIEKNLKEIAPITYEKILSKSHDLFKVKSPANHSSNFSKNIQYYFGYVIKQKMSKNLWSLSQDINNDKKVNDLIIAFERYLGIKFTKDEQGNFKPTLVDSTKFKESLELNFKTNGLKGDNLGFVKNILKKSYEELLDSKEISVYGKTVKLDISNEDLSKEINAIYNDLIVGDTYVSNKKVDSNFLAIKTNLSNEEFLKSKTVRLKAIGPGLRVDFNSLFEDLEKIETKKEVDKEDNIEYNYNNSKTKVSTDLKNIVNNSSTISEIKSKINENLKDLKDKDGNILKVNLSVEKIDGTVNINLQTSSPNDAINKIKQDDKLKSIIGDRKFVNNEIFIGDTENSIKIIAILENGEYRYEVIETTSPTNNDEQNNNVMTEFFNKYGIVDVELQSVYNNFLESTKDENAFTDMLLNSINAIKKNNLNITGEQINQINLDFINKIC